jgi:ferric iron reductase protein FhuF
VSTIVGLSEAATLGPYFAVELSADGPHWLALSALVDDPPRLRERVATTRQLLADRCGLAPEAIDERATASIYFLGLAARLVSPAFGAAPMTSTVPVIALGDVHWQPVDGGPIPLAVTSRYTREASSTEELADLLYQGVVSMTVVPVALAVQRVFRLSPQVVWGNVASAIAGAAKMVGAARPDLAQESLRLAECLLKKGQLTGRGHNVRSADPTHQGHQFVRNNCCLFYRIPGGGLCADCVLAFPSTTPSTKQRGAPGGT